MTNTVLFRQEDGIGTVTLNRPEKHNTFTPEMLTEFDRVMDEAGRDPAIRVVIVRGEGRSFSAGYDMVGGTASHSATLDEDRDRQVEHLRRWNMVRDLPKPVIAMVHGYCFAGATHLCLSCDLVFAADDAVFGSAKIPAGSGFTETMWTLAVGPQKAKYVLFLPGAEVSGKEAEAMGFAARSFPPQVLEEETYRYARRIAKVPPELMKIKKFSINRVVDMQGRAAAVMSGAEWNTIAHFSKGAETIRKSIKEKGLRGAIEWYQAP